MTTDKVKILKKDIIPLSPSKTVKGLVCNGEYISNQVWAIKREAFSKEELDNTLIHSTEFDFRQVIPTGELQKLEPLNITEVVIKGKKLVEYETTRGKGYLDYNLYNRFKKFGLYVNKDIPSPIRIGDIGVVMPYKVCKEL